MDPLIEQLTIGSGRLVPTASAVIGLIGVIVGGLALARTGKGRARAITAVIAGLISVIVGGLHAVNAAGGVGTGNGLAGAIAAIILGVIALVLGGVALRRRRL
jgi:hypothetical protein